MKNDINIKKEATRIFWHQIRYCADRYFMRLNIYPGLDMRYKINKAIMAEFKKLVEKQNIETLLHDVFNKRKERRTRKQYYFSNIFSNPIVMDYFYSKSENTIKAIKDDHICFYGGRNHWAKSETDIKILAILKRNYNKRKEV